MHKISREAFLGVLNCVLPGISKKGTIEQSKCVIFQSEWLCSYNSEVCVRTQSGLPEDLECAVEAAPLIAWVDTLTEDELEVGIEGNYFRMRAGRKRSGVKMEGKITLALEDVSLPEKWFNLPKDFAAAVEQVESTAGGTQDKFLSRCVHITPDFMEACNGRQATRYATKTGFTEPVLVLAESLKQTTKLGLTRAGLSKDWIHLRNSSLILSIRRQMGNYPTQSVSNLLQFEGTPATLPKGAEVAAKMGGIFATDKDDRLLIKLTPGIMTVYGEGASGWTDETIDMSYEGEPLSFRIKPAAFVQLVKNHDQCQLSEGKLKVVGDHWAYITVLGRGDEKPAEEPTEPEEEDAEGDYEREDDE